MKIIQNSDLLQKFQQFGFQSVGHVIAFLVAFVLILTWVVTAPIFQLSDRIVNEAKQNRHKLKT